MSPVTLISFNFNGYDAIRTHFMPSRIDCVYVTDGNQHPDGWTICPFNKYPDNPWLNSLYVRYHPFEFSNSEYVVVIDGSLSVTEGIDELVEKFISGRYDIGVLLSHQPDLIGRVYRWRAQNRISSNEAHRLTDMVKSTVGLGYKGTVAGAVRLYRRTDESMDYLDRCWHAAYDGVNAIRLDEVPATIELENSPNLKIMPLSTEIIQGSAFIYHGHGGSGMCCLYYDKSCAWLRNMPVDPIKIGPEYNRKYLHKTEAMCLTRYFDESGLRHWLDWHLDIGFSHIHIFDNESGYDCESICKEYGSKVSYELIRGNARHYRIFDEYVNSNRCQSEWIMPIDDDEYLSLNTDAVQSVGSLIDWFLAKYPNENMFAIRWKHMFPKVFHSECTGNITDYCTEENTELASMFQPMGDRGIKTMVRRYGKIHYEETEENPSGGHVPRHSASNGALLCNGERIRRCSCSSVPEYGLEPARLLHFRYKGYSWYKRKEADIENRGVALDNTSSRIYTGGYRFGYMLDMLE